MKLPDLKKEQGDILSHIRGEKNDALKQRDEAVEMNDELRRLNRELDQKVQALHYEVEAMKNKLKLLTELNNRLASTLDLTRGRLEEYLKSVPQYELGEMQSALSDVSVAPADHELPQSRLEKRFAEE